MINIDVFSDPVCPWCYIGKENLDRALESRPDHRIVIAWHPFQLNPDMPPEGVDRRAYLEAKFGGGERATQIYARVEEAARGAGLTIDFATIPRVPNTMNAHRLIHWAGLEGRQTVMVSALFRAYWREGLDIGDPVVLASLAAQAGLNPEAVARLLSTDADIDDLRARDTHARERGVNAVPTFVVANTYVVAGAQSPHRWEQIIAELSTV